MRVVDPTAHARLRQAPPSGRGSSRSACWAPPLAHAHKSALLLAVLGVLTCALLAPSSAFAHWRRNRDVILNSAHTLEEGQLLVGVFSPMQYGLTDSLMLGLHPILELILTPNVSLRLKLYEGTTTISIAAGYLQTFLTERSAEAGGGFPGSAETAVLVSIDLSPHVLLSFTAGYALDFATIREVRRTFRSAPSAGTAVDFTESTTESTLDTALSGHGVLYGVGVNWRLDHRQLLALQARAVARVSDGVHEIPAVTLLYGYAWERTRLGAGLAAGRFAIRTGDSEVVNLPVYPVVDLWFRL